MNDHFITKIHIKDFKCFDDFKAEGFTQVNLIGGKNNVGKTAFMEACFVNAYAKNINKFVTALVFIKSMREILNMHQQCVEKKDPNLHYFLEKSKNSSFLSNINKSCFKIKQKNGLKEYIFTLKKKKTIVNVNQFFLDLEIAKNVNFIDSFGHANIRIISAYSYLQKKDEESYLNNLLTYLDPKIEAFKIIDEKPQCKIEGEYREITELGDGVRHLVSIVTSLYASENGYLFIDEIDNGIHFTMLDKIWESILTLSQKLNVQVFATTHSKECIESFNHMQLKIKNKKSSYFEIARSFRTHSIFMRGLDSEQLEYELTHQGRYRGE